MTTAPVFLADRSSLAADMVVLSGPEGRHAATVRRLRPGERAELTDGAGLVASSVVSSVAGNSVTFEVLERRLVPRAEPLLTVVQALPKGDRGELAVETMTEAGVDTVVPWAAGRSIAVWRGDKASRGAERWRSAAVQAGKQARRAWLPEVTELASVADVEARIAKASRAIVLEADAAAALSSVSLPSEGEIVLVVGPEGGISPGERVLFTTAGATECRLGPTVLRTSTAGVAAAAVILTRVARWLPTPAVRARARGAVRALFARYARRPGLLPSRGG